MKILQPTLLERIAGFLCRPFAGDEQASALSTEALTEIYCGGMLENGNFLYRDISRRWASHIHIDEPHLEEIKLKAQQGVLVYVTFNLGQLDYLIFNDTFRAQNLPPALFNNALRVRRWLTPEKFQESYFERIAFLARHKKIPDPFASGYLKELIENSKSVLFSFEARDPDLLSTPTEFFLTKMLELQKTISKPIFIVPLQLVWDKRPKKEKASFFEALFGENESPGKWRKIILFLRHYKKRAIVKFGKPFPLSEFQEKDVVPLYQQIVRAFQIERRNLTGPLLHPKEWFLEKIFEDESISKMIYEISKEKAKPVESVKQLGRKYAKEIVADLRYHYIEFTAAILDWIFKHLFDGLLVDQEGIKNLKKMLAKGPVVLVPNHRSHLDYLLMGYLCYHHDIVSPYTAGGINLSFFPLGYYFRRCGAFFLRRSFEGNKLYKKIFQTYLKILIQEGYLQEFFIEGGRSRSGKLRPPRLGMLSMYSECLEAGAAKDICFMPVSITYDRILEEKAYAEETQGKEKQKEKWFDLLKLPQFLRTRYGKIYVHFDEPISWREACAEFSGAAWETKKPKLVSKLADRICHAINRQVVVTPKSLAASALLLEAKRGIVQEKGEETFQHLLKYLLWKQVRLSETLHKNPHGAFREALKQFEAGGFLKKHQGLEKAFYEIVPEKRIELDFFKNVSIHYFVSLSLISNLLLSRQDNLVLTPEQLIPDYAQFQNLFQYEFRFSTRRALREHLDKLFCYLQEQKAIVYQNGRIEILKEGIPLLTMLSHLIRNYLEGYSVAWETFLLKPTEALHEKELIKAMMGHAKDQLLLGNLKYPESASQSIFENTLHSLEPIHAKKIKEALESLLKSY